MCNLSFLSGGSELVELGRSAGTPVSVRTREGESPAPTERHQQIFVTGGILNAALTLESRDWVISETEFGAVGEREKNGGSSTSGSFGRLQREKIEIGRRVRELEKLDRTTCESMGDMESDCPKETVYHLLTLQEEPKPR